MFNISKVENHDFYIDMIFKNLNEFSQKKKLEISEKYKKVVSFQKKKKEDNNLNKRKDLELEKIKFISFKTNAYLKKVVKSFPNLEKENEIYKELLNTNELNYDRYVECLKKINGICFDIGKLSSTMTGKIKRTNNDNSITFIMKKFLGKANSYYSKNKKIFKDLEVIRIFLIKLPRFLDMKTISICGFPNVGKSTLMKKMSKSKVEIKNYPFTTKKLMFSYLKIEDKKVIQLIDTPGLLGREKTNLIEKRANIVINNYSSNLIFVIDLTQSCGYSIKNQLKLLDETKKNNSQKDIFIFLSKVDIFEDEDFEEEKSILKKIKKFEIFRNDTEMKDRILKDLNYREIKLIK